MTVVCHYFPNPIKTISRLDPYIDIKHRLSLSAEACIVGFIGPHIHIQNSLPFSQSRKQTFHLLAIYRYMAPAHAWLHRSLLLASYLHHLPDATRCVTDSLYLDGLRLTHSHFYQQGADMIIHLQTPTKVSLSSKEEIGLDVLGRDPQLLATSTLNFYKQLLPPDTIRLS